MKKVISTILALVMVLAVVAAIPMTASAEFVVSGSELTHTSQVFDQSSTTGLDAYRGTPTIGNETGTIKDAAWDGAYKLTLNSDSNSYFVNGTLSAGYNMDVWLLWDDNNLYILEYVRTTSVDGDDTLAKVQALKDNNPPASYSGWQSVMYNILLPREINGSKDSSTYLCAKSYMVYTVPLLKEKGGVTAINAANAGKIFEGSFHIRDNEYQSKTAGTTGKAVLNWQSLYDGGMRSYVETKADGYMTETKIPWDIVDSTIDDSFVASEGVTIGMKIYPGSATHINNGGGKLNGNTLNGDTLGYDPVTLCAAATNTNYNTFAPTIAPDYDHWLGENGQFTITPPVTIVDDKATAATKATYYINDAGDLLALAHLLETEAYNGTRLAPFKFTAKGDKSMLSEDKTFKLTADIDLNPGVDWAKANDFLVKKNNGEACDFAKAGTPLPVNVFVGFDWFYGIIDGQGYSIKGVYSPETNSVSKRSNGNTNDMGGFVGRLGQGGFVDLVIESGYVGTGVLNGNGQFGGIVANVYAGGKTDASVGIIISNLYVGSNYTVHRYGVRTEGETNAYPIAGVVTTMWSSGASNVPIVYKNVVFNGTLIDKYSQENSVYGSQAYLFGRARTSNVGGGYSKVTIEDCIVNGASNKFAVVTETDNNTVIKRCDFVQTVAEGKVTIPEANAGYWVALNDGTAAPIKIADKYTDFKWQATVAENGKYAVRLVGELDSLNYNDAKFIVTLIGTKNGVTKTMTVDFTADKTPALAYSSLIANDQTVTADDVDFGMVEGDYFFVAVLNNLDTSVTYEVSAQAVYTLADGTVVTGVAQDLGQVAAWTNN